MRNHIGLLAWLLVGMTLSETQTLGFAEKVRKLLEEVRRALEKAGWDVDAVVPGLTNLHEATLAAGETQEAAKRQARVSEWTRSD